MLEQVGVYSIEEVAATIFEDGLKTGNVWICGFLSSCHSADMLVYICAHFFTYDTSQKIYVQRLSFYPR